MKRMFYIIVLFSLSMSCKEVRVKGLVSDLMIETDGLALVRKMVKLDSLMSISKDFIIEYFDLSGDSIKVFPNLSGYTIRSLNLSNNQLDTLIAAYLPQKLNILNLSHKKLEGLLRIHSNTDPYLKELDVSFNKIKKLGISEPLYRIIVSHNDLFDLDINHINMRYIEICFNSHLSNKIGLYPSQIDTIIHKGIANDEPLYNPTDPSFERDICAWKITPDTINK